MDTSTIVDWIITAIDASDDPEEIEILTAALLIMERELQREYEEAQR